MSQGTYRSGLSVIGNRTGSRMRTGLVGIVAGLCFALPMAGSAGVAAQSPVIGTISAVDSAGTVVTGPGRIVYLVPVSGAIRNEWRALCQRQDREEKAREAARDERPGKGNGGDTVGHGAAERDERLTEERLTLLQRHAAWRVTSSEAGEFAFDGIPRGTYWMLSAMRVGARQYHWVERISVPLRRPQSLTERNATAPGCRDGLP